MEEYVKSSDLVFHRLDDLTAVYHRKLGGLCLLDASALAVLENFKQPQSLSSAWQERKSRKDRLIEQLLGRSFLVKASSIQEEIHGKSESVTRPKINVIQLVVVNGCNFGCTYCFEGIQGVDLEKRPQQQPTEHSSLPMTDVVRVNLEESVYSSSERELYQHDPKNRLMTPEAAVKYVDIALTMASNAEVPSVMIQFFGGEPLLNPRAILAVLESIGHGQRYGVDVEYTIVTNGSLVSDEIAMKFKEYNVGICVSFDSLTSSARPLKNGQSSLPLVLDGLQKLQAYDNRVVLNTALCASTFDVVNQSLIEFAAAHGIHEIGLVLDLDPTFYSRYGGEAIAQKVADLVEIGKTFGVIVTGYWHQIFQLLTAFDAVRYRGFKNCSAKGSQLSIEPNGAVFSCKAGSGYFGNILQGEEVFQSATFQQHSAYQFDNPAYCAGCEIEGFCAGLCLGPLQKKFGTIDAVETDACETYRQVSRKLIQSIKPDEVPTFRLAG